MFGNVIVTNDANITAKAGDGIRAYNYGAGDVTVNDESGAITTDGDNPTDGYGNGIYAFDDGGGNITVAMASAATITSAATGIFASIAADDVPSTSSISVTASGTISLGASPPPMVHPRLGSWQVTTITECPM